MALTHLVTGINLLHQLRNMIKDFCLSMSFLLLTALTVIPYLQPHYIYLENPVIKHSGFKRLWV